MVKNLQEEFIHLIEPFGKDNMSVHFSNVATIYDYSRPAPQELVNFFYSQVDDFLKRHYVAPYNILSVGFGTGRVEAELANSSKINVIGVDLSPAMLNEAKKKLTKHIFHLILADGLKTPLRGKINLMIMIHTIQLVKNNEELIKQLQFLHSDLLVGDIFTSLYDNELFQTYFDYIVKSGWSNEITFDKAASKLSKNLEFYGYHQYITKKEIKTTIKLEQVFDIISKRYLSSFWTIPDKVHQNAIEEVNKFINGESIDLKDEVFTRAKADLTFYYLDRSL